MATGSSGPRKNKSGKVLRKKGKMKQNKQTNRKIKQNEISEVLDFAFRFSAKSVFAGAEWPRQVVQDLRKLAAKAGCKIEDKDGFADGSDMALSAAALGSPVRFW